MNETITLLKQHSSIRKFTKDPVTGEQLEAILTAAQQASTSSNMQAYSVIGITDKELRSELAKLAGNQAYVEESPVFLVWCADLYRWEQAAKRHYDGEMPSSTENFIIATVDATLAAQNAAVAAESLGLGIVYIGGIRNHPDRVAELLGLPQYVYPVFGMCIGVPDQSPLDRPRLPLRAVYFENSYKPDTIDSAIDDYDETLSTYMKARSNGKVSTTWSLAMAGKAGPVRMHMRSFLQKQGFKLE
ncbi:oxygen-insensitive NADPH nitroreductase [Paenibacillus glycanilyticus]|uniref:oxygen-insensitive NADPH nitroreductase n=1 Tax=Paenibacillus glycanilyticus TaxID=126569 RepID=UPI00203C7572|nr:oxygen-insensitive NADPH nitroreductase [Paenibacillus glycanilyticus]MCM3631041.1 oxygen-insensitive NADPH nitroreductase [Paenibacillus glycanilyticus]